VTGTPTDPPDSARRLLRRRLLAERVVLDSGHYAALNHAALARHLQTVVARLEPQCLGLYWPIRSEFNAPAALAADVMRAGGLLALPFTRRTPREMHYRRWDGSTPSVPDECGIASTDGAEVVPDVVLAPCVGFTDQGFRLGYGGGYFDRWMAAHPEATVVGVAWSAARVAAAEFGVQAHDKALMLIVTELGVV
jgi:5-formyltetrahydrofolate cyclo-ligase